MSRIISVFFLVVLGLSVAGPSTATTKFVKYKKYLIPIQIPPEIDAPSLTATPDDANSVFLVWNQPIGATSYRLKRFDQSTNTSAVIYTGADLTYTDAHAPAGVVTYTLKPCNDEGCSRSNVQASLTLPEINTGGGWTFEDDPIAPTNPDLDGDGVYNDFDFCPFTPPNVVVNIFGCAPFQEGDTGLPFQCVDPVTGQASDDPNCPDDQKDSDFDSVPDVSDAYPLQANGAGFCPAQ